MKVTVKKGKYKSIDWNEVQLVRFGLDKNFIVQVSIDQTQSKNDDCFCGQLISTGKYRNDWTKKIYKPFVGKLTIKQ